MRKTIYAKDGATVIKEIAYGLFNVKVITFKCRFYTCFGRLIAVRGDRSDDLGAVDFASERFQYKFADWDKLNGMYRA